MSQILLTDDSAHALPDVAGRGLCVFARGFAPVVGMEALPFESFQKDARGHLKGIDTLVFCGLSRAMNPGNRTAEVWEALFNQSGGLKKCVVDSSLWVGEPWRIWFPFGMTGARWGGYTYSYIGESHWRAWLDGLRPENPFSLDEVKKWGAGVIRSSAPRYFYEFSAETIHLDASVHAEYAQLRASAFEEARSIGPVITRLSRFAASVCPKRAIPNTTRLFERRRWQVTATDLPVDRWLVDNLTSTVALANGIAEVFHG